jgi:transposase
LAKDLFGAERPDARDHLRRIRFKDPQAGKTLIFLTNLFGSPQTTICELYKARWQVELFFKWIRQHLRIKKLYGTSENAAKVQFWAVVRVCILVASI